MRLQLGSIPSMTSLSQIEMLALLELCVKVGTQLRLAIVALLLGAKIPDSSLDILVGFE